MVRNIRFNFLYKIQSLNIIHDYVYYLLFKKEFFIYKEYVDIWQICNGTDSVFMNLANENILNYVLVILVVRNIFILKVNFFLETNDQ